VTDRRPRYAYIERLSDALLHEGQVIRAPVPVERLARLKGCRVVKYDIKDISGVLFRSDDDVVIGVNSTQLPQRQRFTIAHELGHFLLHHGQKVHYDKDYRVSLRSDLSSAGTDIEEIEANFFAASLLMPERFLHSDPRAVEMDLEDEKAIKALSHAYGVSAQAMTHRLLRMTTRRHAT
jgi:Zn-dependent peptidase ImmA (M78 family)